MCRLIHKTDQSMDRAGKAAYYTFTVILHAELIQLITFPLCSHNFCWAVGSAGQCLFAIPMGGGGAVSVHSPQICTAFGLSTYYRHVRVSGVCFCSSSGRPRSVFEIPFLTNDRLRRHSGPCCADFLEALAHGVPVFSTVPGWHICTLKFG